jgi:hypothetical protein
MNRWLVEHGATSLVSNCGDDGIVTLGEEKGGGFGGGGVGGELDMGVF